MSNPVYPNLPHRPMTADEQKLFVEYLPLARRAATQWGAKKYGARGMREVMNSAMIGLMCACVRYDASKSTAAFKTFATNTINWIMWIEYKRERGIKLRRPVSGPTYSPDAYRATGDLPDATFEFEDSTKHYGGGSDALAFVNLVAPDNSSALRTEQLRTGRARTVQALLHRNLPGRDVAFLERNVMHGETLESIGKQHGVSRERVRQIVKRALKNAAVIAAPLRDG